MVHFPCCISCYLLHNFSCPSGIFFINLTAIIKMVMSEVLTRILLLLHMLCQPLFRGVISVALITIKLKILHSQSENRNLRKNYCFPNFSVFLAFSAGSVSYTDSVVVSLIFTASLEMTPISMSTGSWVLFLDIGDV